MYLHIGQGQVLRTQEIVGIFDLDNASVTRATRDFLRAAQRQGRVVNVCDDGLPRSFIVQANAAGTVYLCQTGAPTLKKRCAAAPAP